MSEQDKQEKQITAQTSHFLAMISRMKYIDRWALMRNSRKENLSEHALEVAMISHLLATIGNVYFGKDYDADRAAVYGLYHDATEIITGDMPTPIKYYNPEMRATFAQIEEQAADNLLDMLPKELRDSYEGILKFDESKDIGRLVKAADKISALIKCVEEERSGNNEFKKAGKACREAIKKMGIEEADKFLEVFLPSYKLTLDELK